MEWLDKSKIKLSQLSTKLKLKLSLAKNYKILAGTEFHFSRIRMIIQEGDLSGALRFHRDNGME